ncbi:hypothetical protein M514_23002 [Trichuris suis]|uniref:Uncharacterized protein n=1 Tax=Trichuris suis TaxID=68888 RepID=A0A085N5P4_9BILA|nr:hypothetical protein M514_23002 [Trichuris suis]
MASLPKCVRSHAGTLLPAALVLLHRHPLSVISFSRVHFHWCAAIYFLESVSAGQSPSHTFHGYISLGVRPYIFSNLSPMVNLLLTRSTVHPFRVGHLNKASFCRYMFPAGTFPLVCAHIFSRPPSGTCQAGSCFAMRVSRISFHRRFRFHAILVLHCFLSMRFVSMGYLSMLSGHTFRQIWLCIVPALPSFYLERGSFSFQLG